MNLRDESRRLGITKRTLPQFVDDPLSHVEDVEREILLRSAGGYGEGPLVA